MSTGHDELLELLRRGHEAGDRDASRYALHLCAERGLIMPPWLAKVVMQAIQTSMKGVADDILGLGDSTRLPGWRRDWLLSRNMAIRMTAERPAIAPHLSTNVLTKRQLIQAVADRHRITSKAIEKVIYRKIPRPRKR